MKLNFLSSERLQKIRNNKIVKLLNWEILELWCGSWFIPGVLQDNNNNKHANNYVWVDFRKDIIDNLKEKFPQYKFIHHDLDEILENAHWLFDTIISIAVIEHIYNQKNFFLTAVKNLKQGWKLIITTPTNFGNDIIYPLLCKMRIRKWNGVLSDHITIYNQERFKVAAKDFWFKIKQFKHFEFYCNQLIILEKE